MNTAIRLANVLLKIQAESSPSAYDNFSKVFGVEGCIAIQSKLTIIRNQIDLLDGKADRRLITYLRTLFSCKNLSRDITSEKSNLSGFHIALNSMAGFMSSDMENIDSNDLTELADMVERLRAKVSSESIPVEYANIIESFLNEIRGAITDIEYGGMEAFGPHIEMAVGKYVLYHEAFDKSGVSKDIIEIYAKVTKIMDDAQVWGGAIGFVLAKLTQ